MNDYDTNNPKEDLSEQNILSKLTNPSMLVTNFSRGLSGKSPVGRGNVWDNKGDKEPLTGDETNQRLTLMLVNWGADVNLMSDKRDGLKLLRSEYRVNKKMLNTLLLDEGCPAKNRPVVVQAFKDTLKHIINIINSSSPTMRKFILKDLQEAEKEIKREW